MDAGDKIDVRSDRGCKEGGGRHAKGADVLTVAMQKRPQDGKKLVGMERFLQVGVDAGGGDPVRLDPDVAVTGHEDAPPAGVAGSRRLEEVKAIDVVHPNVRDDDVERPALDPGQRAPGVGF